jgi:hypothetical protein
MLTRNQAARAFEVALAGVYAEDPGVDTAVGIAYSGFTARLASDHWLDRRGLRQLAELSLAETSATLPDDPDIPAALAVARSFFTYLLERPSASEQLLRDPALVLAALARHDPGLAPPRVAALIGYACPEAAATLAADRRLPAVR